MEKPQYMLNTQDLQTLLDYPQYAEEIFEILCQTHRLKSDNVEIDFKTGLFSCDMFGSLDETNYYDGIFFQRIGGVEK